MTHGKVTYLPATQVPGAKRSRAAWRVECPPHVALRFKRVFQQADKSAHGAIDLVDTTSNARDLLWFLDRYPMEIEVIDLLRRRAGEAVEQERYVSSLFEVTYQPPEVSLAVPLRDYQKTAVDLARKTKCLLLADTMGLGKTASAIGVLSFADSLPAVVVTLAHLPNQWEREIRKFAPDLRVVVPQTGDPERFNKPKRGHFPERWDVCIVSYFRLRTLTEILATTARSVVFDEVQELRKADSAKYRAAKHLADAATLRLGLSGTPIHNYGGEIHAVYRCLSPDALGSFEEFHREWCGDSFSSKPILKHPKAFGTMLRESGMILRRTRSDVERELPPLTRITHQVDSDLSAIDAVSDRAVELARIILAQGGRKKGEALHDAGEFSWRLRQATGVAKAKAVADFVRLLVESGESVVLYGWHREVYSIWQERLADLKPLLYTGSESEKEKSKNFQSFVAGETSVLIVSLRAGAGVDGLQAASKTVVFGELDWSPAVHEQAIARLHRDGQAKGVVAYFLVADSGSDPTVVDILGLKKQQIEQLRDPDAPLFEAIEVDPNHIKRLAEDFLRSKAMSVDATELEVPCA